MESNEFLGIPNHLDIPPAYRELAVASLHVEFFGMVALAVFTLLRKKRQKPKDGESQNSATLFDF